MKSKVVLFLVIMVLCFCSTLSAGEQMRLRQLSRHVWAYVWPSTGDSNGNRFGSNAGLVVGRKGALVIDTLTSAKEARRFLEDVRRITDKPIKYVVNTHYHLDHSWGNCVFSGSATPLLTHEKGLEMFGRSKSMMENSAEMGMNERDLEGTTLVPPYETFSDVRAIDLGGVKVVLRYLGHTHSPDSIVVDIPTDEILFTGDILFTGCHPFMAEGDYDNWRRQLVRMGMGPERILVPGHGPLSDKQDLREMGRYLIRFDLLARKMSAGKTQTEAPEIAQELLKLLPVQRRGDNTRMIIMNLVYRYLPKP